MKLIRITGVLAVTLLATGSLYAYLLVSAQASTKATSYQAVADNLIGDPVKGAYVGITGGCTACHTDFSTGGKPMAGGVPIKTPFGTFYSSNITSDKNAGIGNWTIDEFLAAMTLGLSPDNEHYFPAFPYTSYTVMSVPDLVDLKAWLDTVDPVATQAPGHDITWPASFRPGLLLWKAMFFDSSRPGKTRNSGGSRNTVKTIKTDITSNTNSASTANVANHILDRGSYLVNGPGHCAECHSPRNLLGGLSSRSLTGNSRGPDGESVPGISSMDLSIWSVEDLELFLEVGITPTGDFTGGHMTDVIDYGTGLLTAADRTSIAHYLLSNANKP